MNQKNDNFIDKTFTVLADVLIKVLPATKDEKKAFSYYRYGMSAQSNGDYAEALENYYEALKLEEDPYDRSYILYNIGLIYGNNGDYSKALEYYHQALDLNSRMPQALNNIAVITLMRVHSLSATPRGGLAMRCNNPSTRKRTQRSPSCGSKCMSDARFLTANAKRAST